MTIGLLFFFLGRVASTTQDTDYVLLQTNPLFHWVPVNNERESSDDSSCDSTIHLHRANSQHSIASQRSTRSTCSHGRSRSLRRTGSHCNSTTISSRPSSLFVSPPPSPRPAFRSKSTDENYVGNNIPLKPTSSSIYSAKKRRSVSTLSDDTVPTISSSSSAIPISVPHASLEKLSKLKDRLIGGTTSATSAAVGDSDDESTPLVSELSTPTHSQSDSVFRHEYSPDNSSDISADSNKSLPRTSDRSAIITDH